MRSSKDSCHDKASFAFVPSMRIKLLAVARHECASEAEGRRKALPWSTRQSSRSPEAAAAVLSIVIIKLWFVTSGGWRSDQLARQPCSNGTFSKREAQGRRSQLRQRQGAMITSASKVQSRVRKGKPDYVTSPRQ